MRPHNTSDEAPELTQSEMEKIMSFMLPNAAPLDLSAKTLDELTVYSLALSVAYERCKDPFRNTTTDALKELAGMVEQAKRDLIFESNQLPWKE